MAFVSFSEIQRSALQNILYNGSEAEYQSLYREFGVHSCYKTGMGRLVLAAEVKAGAPVEKADPGKKFSGACEREDDPRCQAGQVLSHLESRSKTGPGLDADYAAFRRNVKATVLIVDKSGLEEIGQPNEKGKIQIGRAHV